MREIYKELFSYDPLTGDFFRKDTGEKIGYNHDGYRIWYCWGKKIRLHRLAFFLMGKKVPKVVDHINRIKSDNRWCNLRPATHGQNMMNTGLYKNNTSGYRGVVKNRKGRFIAQFCRGYGKSKKVLYLGSFSCPEEAHKAYLSYAISLYGSEWVS